MTSKEFILVQEVIACLKKYQARYHHTPHAQKDWERSKLAISNIEQQLKKGKHYAKSIRSNEKGDGETIRKEESGGSSSQNLEQTT